MSPWVATTRPSLTATLTPQPVPQKRHGAFDHFMFVRARSPTSACAAPGSGTPATAAAAAAADCLTNSRRVIFNFHLVIHGGRRLAVLIHERGREHTFHHLDAAKRIGDRVGRRCLERDHELAVGG